MSHTDPRHGDQLDRPYGDQESDYVTIQPEDAAAEGQPEGADLLAEQEALAAAEAAAIGGRPVADETVESDFDIAGQDPAFEPVSQAGGGQAQGFEPAQAPLLADARNPPPPQVNAG